MENLKYLKEPGYMYDLFFIFTLHFNKNYYQISSDNYNKSSEDTVYFKQLLLDFGPIPDELFPFFYLKDDKNSFMTQFYYEPYKEEFTTTYNLSSVQTLISDYDQVITNLIKFYFIDVTEKILTECKTSVSAICKLIKSSDYNSDIKCSLYSFFLEPIPVIKKLSYELMAKEFQLSQQYEKNFRKITELQQQVDITLISDILNQCKNQKSDLDNIDNIYISICILNKNYIKEYILKNHTVIILGSNYQNYYQFLISQNRFPKLDVFGDAISENNRLIILDLMVRKNEITMKDLEHDLGFTGSTAYYHLSLMLKANMIKTRNQGRTIFYSVNKRYFDDICCMLSKYSNKPEKGN